MSTKLLTALCAMAGSGIEYYNYMLFMFLIPIWSKDLGPNSGIVKGYGMVFLAALTRPFAAFVIGKIGDKIGRRYALFLCACIMSLACIIMSYLPNYNPRSIFYQYGIIQLVILFCRILQNASVAGKLNGSAIYLLEHNPRNAGLMSGLIWSVTIFGMFLAALAESWCAPDPTRWRMAMRVGAIAVFIGFITIIYLQESTEFKTATKETIKGGGPSFWSKLSVFCIGGSIGGIFYYLSTFIPRHFQNITGIVNIGNERCTILIIYAIGAIIGGLLSDKPKNRASYQIKLTCAYLLLLLISVIVGINIGQLVYYLITFALFLIILLVTRKNIRRGVYWIAGFLSIYSVYTLGYINGLTVTLPMFCFIHRFTSIYTILGLMILAIPSMQSIIITHSLKSNSILILLAGIFVGPSHKVMHNMFPANKRYGSISLFYAIGTATMGGACIYICLKLAEMNLIFPAFYMIFVSFLGLIAIISEGMHGNASGDTDI